jgi:GR25 family glycosyltransferase involved in LPS biosynthesis
MNKINKIFYINLLRRSDRKDHFIKSCNNVKIPTDKVERFNALDGKKYKPSKEELEMFLKCDYLNRWFCNNIICNQLAHYYLLKEIVNQNYNYSIICQDDVYFRDDFILQIEKLMENIPLDAEIINIGFHSYCVGKDFKSWNLLNDLEKDFTLLGNKKINGNICELKKNINPCSLAYIVTLQGAKNLIDYFDSNGFARATDWNFNDYCINKNIFYGSIPVLCTGNPELGSDIF